MHLKYSKVESFLKLKMREIKGISILVDYVNWSIQTSEKEPQMFVSPILLSISTSWIQEK